MHVKSIVQRLGLVIFSAYVVGCGGSDSDPENVVDRVPQVNQSKGFEGPLVQGKAELFVKNGIYAVTLGSTVNPVPVASDASAVPAPSPPSFENVSRTNTIEAGVDEADRVKYDGDNMYIAAYPVWLDGAPTSPHVRVLSRQDDFSFVELDRLEFDSDFTNINGIYLHQDTLTTIGADFPVYPVDALSSMPWHYIDPNLTITIHDVADPANITISSEIVIDGSLKSSRRIGNQLYLVSSYVPYIEALQLSDDSNEAKLQAYRKIIDTPASSLMPKIYKDGQATPLNTLDDCFSPQSASNDDGFSQIMTVTRINLLDSSDITSICMSAYSELMYMSQDNLYIGNSTFDGKTTVHKIHLADMSYQATGEVDGIMGWRSDAAFKISEKDDFLRIVTSKTDNGESEHFLTVLQQQGVALEAVAKLPNEQQTAKIGKPGEDIYAVRFVDDKAYIVTFERIDPLYVIDLTDNTQPFIQGELEIPGFSNYLHPMKNGYLLGVGQQVDIQQLPVTGETVIAPPTLSGLKISLFDVSDPSSPQELTSIVKPDAYSPVEFTYKALTVLEQDGAYRFTMPVESWGQNTSDNVTQYYYKSELLMLASDTTDAAPTLSAVNGIEVENDNTGYVYVGDDRGILHGDKVLYVHGNKLYVADWASDSSVTGPF